MQQQAPATQHTNRDTAKAASEKETGLASEGLSNGLSAAPPAAPSGGGNGTAQRKTAAAGPTESFAKLISQAPQPIQRSAEEEEPLQAKAVAQLASTNNSQAPSFSSTIQRKSNNTGLPDQLKAGVESLSGHSMDDVKVHYGSDKPQQLQAHAYAQGTNIHVAPGQERHLPHEAWHVAQQKQGRVKPTMQLKRMNINADSALEHEADVMGAKAMASGGGESFGKTLQKKSTTTSTTAQLMLSKEDMISLTGPPGSSRGLYAKILNALDEYGKNKNPQKGGAILVKLDGLVREWLTKHGGADGKTFEAGQNTLRGRYLKDLPLEIQAEKAVMDEEAKVALGDKLPSNAIRARNTRAETALAAKTTNAGVGGATAKHKFSVVAYVQHPDYGKFAKERMSMTLKNKMKPVGKKSSKTIKDDAAKKVIEDKEAARTDGGKMTHQEKIEAIRRLNGAGVGHAFVEFQKMAPTGEELTKQTFGFFPAIPAPPKEATPGAVTSPDPHANERTVRRLSFEVPQLKFDAGMTKAIGMMRTPPNYTLIGFNCTVFAKEIAKEVGVSFPENAYLAVPFSGKIWNPNDMYDSIAE